MKRILSVLGLLFFSCQLSSELEPTETSNQLSRTSTRTQVSVVAEVFTETW
jgi:hypothetical protein